MIKMYIIPEIIDIILFSVVEMYGESNMNGITEWDEHFKKR